MCWGEREDKEIGVEIQHPLQVAAGRPTPIPALEENSTISNGRKIAEKGTILCELFQGLFSKNAFLFAFGESHAGFPPVSMLNAFFVIVAFFCPLPHLCLRNDYEGGDGGRTQARSDLIKKLEFVAISNKHLAQ